MNQETKQLFDTLLDVCRQQNDIIRKHNNVYRELVETLEKSHRELQTDVDKLKSQMEGIKETALRILQ